MLQITSVAQIQAFDRALDRQGQTVLYVERAAHALLDACRPDAPVAIVCGGGNNGADGYALGCLLAARGISCHIFRCSAHFSAVGHIFYEQATQEFRILYVRNRQTYLLTHRSLIVFLEQVLPGIRGELLRL